MSNATDQLQGLALGFSVPHDPLGLLGRYFSARPGAIRPAMFLRNSSRWGYLTGGSNDAPDLCL
jgi:hypothetical protein